MMDAMDIPDSSTSSLISFKADCLHLLNADDVDCDGYGEGEECDGEEAEEEEEEIKKEKQSYHVEKGKNSDEIPRRAALKREVYKSMKAKQQGEGKTGIEGGKKETFAISENSRENLYFLRRWSKIPDYVPTTLFLLVFAHSSEPEKKTVCNLAFSRETKLFFLRSIDLI